MNRKLYIAYSLGRPEDARAAFDFDFAYVPTGDGRATWYFKTTADAHRFTEAQP